MLPFPVLDRLASAMLGIINAPERALREIDGLIKRVRQRPFIFARFGELLSHSGFLAKQKDG